MTVVKERQTSGDDLRVFLSGGPASGDDLRVFLPGAPDQDTVQVNIGTAPERQELTLRVNARLQKARLTQAPPEVVSTG